MIQNDMIIKGKRDSNIKRDRLLFFNMSLRGAKKIPSLCSEQAAQSHKNFSLERTG